MLLTQAIADFLLSLQANGRAERTIGSYRQRLAGLQSFLDSHGTKELERITPGHVDAWAAALRQPGQLWEDHPFKRAERGELSEATVAGRIGAAKSFLRWCVQRGYLDNSPARSLRRPTVNPSARDKVMDPDDLALMLQEAGRRANEGRPRDLALLAFLADTGCRVGEVANLRLSRLYLLRHEALIAGKTGERYVDFGETAAGALASWLEARPGVDHDSVFTGRSGDPLTVNGIYQALKRVARAAGVTGRFNPHAIRHLIGQHFTDETNLELARQKLGHRNISTTANFYAHQDRERVRRATQRLSFLNPDE